MENYLKLYHDHGFILIPSKFKTKIPTIKWAYYRDNKQTWDEVQAFFKYQRNVAILCGKLSGVCAIDFDSQEAINKFPELSSIKTFTVKSNRGIHKYFKHPGIDLVNVMKHKDYPDIDFKMNNALITAPPSVHSSGLKYEAIEGINSNKIELADLPEVIVKLCTKKERFHTNISYNYNFPVIANIKKIPLNQLFLKFGIEQKGDHYYCFSGHDKDSASLKIYDKTNTYYCFGCGKGGSPINLVKDVKGLSHVDAVNFLLNLS